MNARRVRTTFLCCPSGRRYGQGPWSRTRRYETNLAFSKIVSDRWTLHFNAGMSMFPNVRNHDLTSYNLGASAIFAVSRNLNLMLETVAGWNNDIAEGVLSPEAIVNRSATALHFSRRALCRHPAE